MATVDTGSRALSVLVIDDDAGALLVVSALLRKLGCAVSTQAGSLGTTARVLREMPAVIVVDLDMPGLSGQELIRVISKSGTMARRAPPACIVYSGADESELARLATELGLLGYVRKTSDLALLSRAFSNLLSRVAR